MIYYGRLSTSNGTRNIEAYEDTNKKRLCKTLIDILSGELQVGQYGTWFVATRKSATSDDCICSGQVHLSKSSKFYYR